MKALLVSKNNYFTSLPECELDHLQYDQTSMNGHHGAFSLKSIVANIRNITRLRKLVATGDYDFFLFEVMGDSMGGRYIRRLVKALYQKVLLHYYVQQVSKSRKPIVVLDIKKDAITIHPVNKTLLDASTLYFKRELAVDRWQSSEAVTDGIARYSPMVARSKRPDDFGKLRPISLGLGKTEVQIMGEHAKHSQAKKTVDLFYAHEDMKKPLRTEAMAELKKFIKSGHDLNFRLEEKKIPFEEYCAALAQASTCLSPPGLGWDCYRHYEAALFATVPILVRPYIYQDTPFVHGESCIHYDPQRPLEPQLLPWFEDPERLQQMGLQAQEHMLTHHTEKARFQRILRYLKDIPNSNQ